MHHRLCGKGFCRTELHSASSEHDVMLINMDCIVGTWSKGSIPSLAGREAQRGEVAQGRVLAPASSLAHCQSGPVLLPALTSDVSAAK